MADADFIAPAIRNGGAGSPDAQVNAVSRAPDYRQLQNPESVRTDLPSSGAAERAAALANTFKEFGGIASEFGSKIYAQQGAIAGAAAGATGHPDYKEGLNRFSAYNQAFNNAATGAYAVQAEAQADDSAARLRVQANNDPATFATTYAAVRDAVLKTAPAQAVPMLTELYNKRLAAGLAAISGDQATEIRNTQRDTYNVGVQKQLTRVATLQGSDNPHDQLAAQDEQVKLSLLIDGGKNAGLYSAAEAEAMHISSARQITAQVFETQFNAVLSGDRKAADGNTGALGAVNLLDGFQKAHIANSMNPDEPTILSEPEYQKLYADGVTKLREYNLGIAAVKRDGKTAEEMKFEAGDNQYTSLFLQGKLTDRALDIAVRSGDLKPERATSLHQLMLNGPQAAKSDPNALFRLHTDPNFLDMTADDIAKYPGVNPIDGLKAVEEIDRRKNSWEGTQAAKQGKGSILAALKIPSGTPMAALSEEQRKAATDATQDYIARMNALEPAKRDGSALSVAQDVIKSENQKQAAAELQQWQYGRAAVLSAHGPGSDEPYGEEKLKATLKRYDDNIARSAAAAKGQ